MKKTIIVLLTIVMVTALLCVFASCGKSEEVGIESYKEIATTNYSIGDKYASTDIVVEANLKDGTTAKITKNLIFVGEDALALDDEGKFTTTGTYTLNVYAVEQREELPYKVGTWTIKVV